jgi:hypothetical protein
MSSRRNTNTNTNTSYTSTNTNSTPNNVTSTTNTRDNVSGSITGSSVTHTVDLSTPLSAYLKPTPTNSNKKTSFKLDLNNSIADDFTSIYDDPICSTLLKNDCVLYGDFVIDFFAHNKLDFKKKITAFADASLRFIIERDLYGKIYKKTFNETYTTFGYKQYIYKCSYEHYFSDVIITYVDYLNKLDGGLLKEHCLFNIDTLIITRREIKTLAWTSPTGEPTDADVPLPMGVVISDISNKRFQLLQHLNTIERLNRAINYIKAGWFNNLSQITYDTQKTHIGKLCEICHEKIRSNCKVLNLKCNHYFHTECWYETLKQHITGGAKTDFVSCPTCRKTYYIYEVV